MCNDVIAGDAYTAVLLESCDLSARRASSPKPYPGCCGGDSSLDIISAFLSLGHAGSFFVCFNSTGQEMPSAEERGSKITYVSSSEERKHPLTSQSRLKK